MKKTIAKHKKKSIAGLVSLATIITLIQFWGQVYPVVCPLIKNKEVCEATGKIGVALATTLDNNNGSIQLDAGEDAGVTP